MFADAAQFPFAAELERHWQTIRDEMVALRTTGFIAWPEKSLYGETGWSTFGLYAFGQKQTANCALCPRTTELVESIPGLTTAGFSPRSIAVAVSMRVASIMYRLPPMRASASSTPSNLPIAVLNCVRTRACTSVAVTCR